MIRYDEMWQALLSGCLLHFCCRLQEICYQTGDFKGYLGMKAAYLLSVVADVLQLCPAIIPYDREEKDQEEGEML